MITMRGFGDWGRAGNQFFQYAFLTGYAQRHGVELRLPAWCGTHLFGCNEKAPTEKLPKWMEPGSGLLHPTPPKGKELVGHDFCGYAQYHTSYFTEDKDRIRKLFRPIEDVKNRLESAVSSLRSEERTVIGIHLRRGDYGRGIFPVIPASWYLGWLSANWKRYKNPLLFISTETLSLVEEFNQYRPLTVETLGIDLNNKPMADCTYLAQDLKSHDRRAMDWYPDFHLLCQCDVILGPSSTFSFVAAMLNPNLQEYWRANLALERFIPVDPWDAYPMLRETVQQFPHLEGIALRRNPPHW